MKAIHKLGIGALALATLASSCTKDFENINKNPEITPDISPEMLITTSQKAMVDRDFDWFYEHYQYLMRYTQFTVSYPDGNTGGMFANPRVNDFYSAFYTNIGRNLTDIQQIVDGKTGSDQAYYAQVRAIATVNKVYSAFRVTDVNGSIPYTEAFLARVGEGSFKPAYDSQEKLFDIFDAELKAAITTLTTAGQFMQVGKYDIFYAGDASKWAKAANVLRLKIAMRLGKRAPQKLQAIATEVMASPAGLFTGVADEWKFISSTNFARGGNWNAQGNATRGGKTLVDFMYDNSDPRLNLFFKKNGFTLAVFNRLKAGGAFPASAVYNPRQYVGMPESPDDRNNPAFARLYGVKRYSIVEGGQNVSVEVDTLSTFQNRIFDLGSDGDLAGAYTQPMVTYAEMCFILSELSLKSIITGDATEWYNKGVTASINAYSGIATLAPAVDFTVATPEAIYAYLAKPAIAFTGTTDEKMEKIGIQQYINSFKTPWEAWGYYKLLGYPKVGGILNRKEFIASGVKQEIPRRWPLPISNQNIDNYNKAVTEMKATGEYGNAVEDITGRVWWDKK
ncbi:SusD/RagB family nutrient-binding outer membrane lipoprotein [Chitinophaga barathri]|uniref:SusD/RagB family nutrient-binding outer membrane lipoprotein n=1 Tax=Chitinophaga barathri TaxID=1647451 RepID=A0A3N4MC26_9BACT|nr:SusD/RagB family nutrient-binding outer membrane lipoprotein [Chitinophaga barathri]RPD40975.1 SusD/RagB family nutrient-binding outer membrane lipoprotein [Chitinophaga barathri]